MNATVQKLSHLPPGHKIHPIFKMGSSSSKVNEPAPPANLTLPLGVLPEFTEHNAPINLEMEIQPSRAFRKKNDLQTIVRVSGR